MCKNCGHSKHSHRGGYGYRDGQCLTTADCVMCKCRDFTPAHQPADSGEDAKCGLCGLPMPEGEEMFNYHGYSGKCPEPVSTPYERMKEVLGIDPEGHRVKCGDCEEWMPVGEGVADHKEETVRCRKCARAYTPPIKTPLRYDEKSQAIFDAEGYVFLHRDCFGTIGMAHGDDERTEFQRARAEQLVEILNGGSEPW